MKKEILDQMVKLNLAWKEARTLEKKVTEAKEELKKHQAVMDAAIDRFHSEEKIYGEMLAEASIEDIGGPL